LRCAFVQMNPLDEPAQTTEVAIAIVEDLVDLRAVVQMVFEAPISEAFATRPPSP